MPAALPLVLGGFPFGLGFWVSGVFLGFGLMVADRLCGRDQSTFVEACDEVDVDGDGEE